MKECPYCLGKYSEDIRICPRDHNELRVVTITYRERIKPAVRKLSRPRVDLTMELSAGFESSTPSLWISIGLICLGGLLPWVAVLLLAGGRSPRRFAALLMGMLVLQGFLVGVGVLGLLKATLKPRRLPVGWILVASPIFSPIAFIALRG